MSKLPKLASEARVLEDNLPATRLRSKVCGGRGGAIYYLMYILTFLCIVSMLALTRYRTYGGKSLSTVELIKC